MKYYPILSAREAELNVIQINKNNDIEPYLVLIKEKLKKNSKRTLIEEFKEYDFNFFLEVIRGVVPANTTQVIKDFIYRMSNNREYENFLIQASINKKCSVVINSNDLLQINREVLKKLGSYSIKVASPSELMSLNFMEDSILISKKIFIEFNPEVIEGTLKNFFDHFYNKNKKKIIFVFENHKKFTIKSKVEVSDQGLVVRDNNKISYESYPTDGFADYCTMKKNELPPNGGRLSPSISIPLSLDNTLIVGTKHKKIEDSKFTDYLDILNELFKREDFKDIEYTALTRKILEDAKEKRMKMTPARAKIITLDHYISMIKYILANW